MNFICRYIHRQIPVQRILKVADGKTSEEKSLITPKSENQINLFKGLQMEFLYEICRRNFRLDLATLLYSFNLLMICPYNMGGMYYLEKFICMNL